MPKTKKAKAKTKLEMPSLGNASTEATESVVEVTADEGNVENEFAVALQEDREEAGIETQSVVEEVELPAEVESTEEIIETKATEEAPAEEAPVEPVEEVTVSEEEAETKEATQEEEPTEEVVEKSVEAEEIIELEQPQQTQEDVDKLIQQLEGIYQVPADIEVDEFLAPLNDILPKYAAKLHLALQQQIMLQIQPAVEQALQTQRSEQSSNDSFYQQWPQIKHHLDKNPALSAQVTTLRNIYLESSKVSGVPLTREVYDKQFGALLATQFNLPLTAELAVVESAVVKEMTSDGREITRVSNKKAPVGAPQSGASAAGGGVALNQFSELLNVDT